MSRAARSAGLLVGVAVVIALSGCAATSSTPQPMPDPVASTVAGTVITWPVADLAGKGPTEKTFEVPPGAKSMQVVFTCTAGVFAIATNSRMSDNHSGPCGGTRTYRVSLPKGSQLRLSIMVPAATTFTLSTDFTSDLAGPDAAIAAACTTVSSADAIIQGAEAAYKSNTVSRAGWQMAMTQAGDELKALSTTATGVIGQQLPSLVQWVTGPAVTPANLLSQQSFVAANTAIDQVCADNGTPVAIHSSAGG